MDHTLKTTAQGYRELANKPSAEELQHYYQQKYYQQPTGQYQKDYSAEERLFFKNKARVCLETLKLYGQSAQTLLELGAGEGFFAQACQEAGLAVTLNDLSSAGMEAFNPSLLAHLHTGDSVAFMAQLAADGQRFDLISLDNVLEHVLDPAALLNTLRSLMSDASVVRITVPNDFSSFQQLLIDQQLTTETWVCPPDHLFYFNASNLVEFAQSQGFEPLSVQVDFPIELFLTNEHAHYYRDRSLGKAAHRSRVTCTNYLVEKDVQAYIKYCEYGAKLEFGRDTTIYLRRA